MAMSTAVENCGIGDNQKWHTEDDCLWSLHPFFSEECVKLGVVPEDDACPSCKQAHMANCDQKMVADKAFFSGP